MHPKLASPDVTAVQRELGELTRMAVLRGETRAAHDRIEHALPVMDAGLTRARYLQIVEAFYGYYVGIEPLVDAHQSPSKVALLVTDLLALGHTASDIAALRHCVTLPAITTPSSALGARYVIEGSTLGGQLISRRLAQTLQLDARTGAAFFTGYADQTRPMWSAFCAMIEAELDFDPIAAANAAIATFETLERWLVTSLAVS